ncbi:MAG: hypothetical protein KJN63_09205, partial [Acidimicrobiia bacterium]|nr:hypothetical protein [Acidimicrobiia bacterium]
MTVKQPPLISEPSVETICSLLRHQDFVGLVAAERRRLTGQLELFGRAEGTEAGTYEPKAAHAVLLPIRRHLERLLVESTSGYSAQRWLWSMRRLALATSQTGKRPGHDFSFLTVEIASRLSPPVPADVDSPFPMSA